MEVHGHENHFETGNSAGFWAYAHRLAYVAHVGTADGVSSAKPYVLAERQKRRQRGRVRPYHGVRRGLYHLRRYPDGHGARRSLQIHGAMPGPASRMYRGDLRP